MIPLPINLGEIIFVSVLSFASALIFIYIDNKFHPSRYRAAERRRK